MSPEAIAQEVYGAYGKVTDFKNFQGNPMPKWEELPPKIQEAWVAATNYAMMVGYKPLPLLDEREKAQVRHARAYSSQFSSAGAPGHGQFILIAKLAETLGL